MTDENQKINDLAEAVSTDTEKAVAHPGETPTVAFYIKPDKEGEADFANAIGRINSKPGVSIVGIGYTEYAQEEDEGPEGYDEVTVSVVFN